MFTMARKRRKFSKEFKAEVVQLGLPGANDLSQIAKEQGTYDSYVYGWIRQAKIDSGSGPSDALTSSEKQELSAFRRENRELRRERNFSKEAAADFAKAKKCDFLLSQISQGVSPYPGYVVV